MNRWKARILIDALAYLPCLAARGALPAVTTCLLHGIVEAQCAPIEDSKVLAEDGVPGTGFGHATALSGNTLVVGANSDDENGDWSGSAYVFDRHAAHDTSWRQVAKLLPSDGNPLDQFGYSADIDGNTIVIGSIQGGQNSIHSGAAYVFERQSGTSGGWGQVAKLVPPDAADGATFGVSVAISGDACAIGAYTANTNGIFGSGAAYVFERNLGGANRWGLAKKLVPEDAGTGAQFGIFVAIDRSTLLVGAPGTAHWVGGAYVFERDALTGNWGETAKLLASDGTYMDQFCGVSISGDTAVVGACTDDEKGQYSGSAYVFQRDWGGTNQWGQVRKLQPADGESFDQFGSRTSIYGDLAVISAGLDSDAGHYAGSVYVFHRHCGGEDAWGELAKLEPSDSAPWDGFAYPDVFGDSIVVGATRYLEPGAVYSFDSSLSYPPRTYCTAKPSSVPDCIPSIQGSGVASASASSGFRLSSGRIPGESIGLFLYTFQGATASRRTALGWLCIDDVELHHTTALVSGGTLGHCDGMLSIDWNSYNCGPCGPNAAAAVPGAKVDGQFWYRDAGSPGGANLTDAIGFGICR
jgi:FG-GAP repeat